MAVVSRWCLGERCLVRQRDRLPVVRGYAVLSEQMGDEALELFVNRQIAERMVETWGRDEPGCAGELHVGAVELEASLN